MSADFSGLIAANPALCSSIRRARQIEGHQLPASCSKTGLSGWSLPHCRQIATDLTQMCLGSGSKYTSFELRDGRQMRALRHAEALCRALLSSSPGRNSLLRAAPELQLHDFEENRPFGTESAQGLTPLH